jgi:RNA polymerase sigma factor (sigma-70 family)
VQQDVRVNGDEDVERLYRDHGRRLWWALLAYCGDREVASDAVSEAFAQVLRRGDAVRDPAAWVWRAAFKLAGGELARRRRASPVEEDRYEMPEETVSLMTALRRLSPRQRAVVVLHDYAGYARREVASILGIAAPTVGVHLHRARARLRTVLEVDDD